MVRVAVLLAATALSGAVSARANDAKVLALGKHLAGECTTCHRIDGTDNGIPAIIGWPADEFVTTMKFYKDGARPNAAMRSVAESLDDQQLAALAAYFGALPKPLPRKK